MDIRSEMGSDEWLKPLGFQLEESRILFLKTLKNFKTNPEAIHVVQEPIHALRETVLITNVEKMNRLFLELKGFEEKLTEFRTKPEEWEAESISQLVFTQEWSKPLNQIPVLLPALSIFKIYVVPFFAVLIPLVAWILPFLILRFVFNVPMPFNIYMTTLSSMWLGGKLWSSMNLGEKARILFQTSWTAFGLIQGVIQPVQQAFHMKKIDDSILERVSSFRSMRTNSPNSLQRIRRSLGKKSHAFILKSGRQKSRDNSMRIFATILRIFPGFLIPLHLLKFNGDLRFALNSAL
jgi:hypothetical protein